MKLKMVVLTVDGALILIAGCSAKQVGLPQGLPDFVQAGDFNAVD